MPCPRHGVSRRKRTNGEKSSTDDELFVFCEVALFINTACVINPLARLAFSASSTELHVRRCEPYPVQRFLILENYEI